MSKALKADGFRFVGSTTLYAFMQSTGMVNDHLVYVLSPRRLRETSKETQDRRPMSAGNDKLREPGSACCRDAASICCRRNPKTSRSRTSPTDLARVARWNGQTIGEHAFSVAQHSLVVTDILAALEPAFERKAAYAPALLHDAAGICDR